jgi:hypothetical protein
VQWLYAFRDIEAYKTELAEQGWSLRIWWGWANMECRIGVSHETDSDDGLEFKEAGGPLTDWEITAHGWTRLTSGTPKSQCNADELPSASDAGRRPRRRPRVTLRRRHGKRQRRSLFVKP